MVAPCVQETWSQKAIYKQDTISLIVRLLPCGGPRVICLGEHAIHGLGWIAFIPWTSFNAAKQAVLSLLIV